ncbi:2-oxoacid:acceptor oxidoreductase family protein [Candidatus Bipolaricaulota bacterium]|nr:2-oxoacid:acceptor oxidoreductase family protein [Candidatus Bipolaricaulota bacterium]
MSYDIYLVGVGGQGILTLADLIVRAAVRKEYPVSFFPTKGMAQRGGFVKAELRLGQGGVGPHIRENGAHLVIAMERSEALKGVRYARPEGDFLLYGHVWEPTAVMLGEAAYPSLESVLETVRGSNARLVYLDSRELPKIDGGYVAANIFVLGAAFGNTTLGEVLNAHEMTEVVQARWPRRAKHNVAAFDAGLRVRGTS